MTDTTKYPGMTIAAIFILMGTVDWMADYFFSLF